MFSTSQCTLEVALPNIHTLGWPGPFLREWEEMDKSLLNCVDLPILQYYSYFCSPCGTNTDILPYLSLLDIAMVCGGRNKSKSFV